MDIYTKIRRDREWEEWQVDLYIDHKLLKDARYHTDSKEDAILTGRQMFLDAQKIYNGREIK